MSDTEQPLRQRSLTSLGWKSTSEVSVLLELWVAVAVTGDGKPVTTIWRTKAEAEKNIVLEHNLWRDRRDFPDDDTKTGAKRFFRGQGRSYSVHTHVIEAVTVPTPGGCKMEHYVSEPCAVVLP